MKTIRVRLGDRSYNILIGSNILRGCGPAARKLVIGDDSIVITNGRLRRLYGRALARSLKKARITSHFEMVPDSETAKSSRVVTDLINRISRYDERRNVFIISLGGGVVGDVAGFVASVYKRGTPYIQVPTTLLAQVDSAIGGKVAVDLPVAKNLIGSFYQPRLVLSDIDVLKTLPPRQLKSGLAEIIKYGVIRNEKLFAYIESNHKRILGVEKSAVEHVVALSAGIKAGIVARDEFDKKGERAVLNFGHTIGHAIEAASGYSSRYTHGEAIAIGMAASSRIAAAMGLLKKADANRIESLIKTVGLPIKARGLNLGRIYSSHLHDKKFLGHTNRFVLPSRIGKALLVANVPDRIIRKAIREVTLHESSIA